MKPLTKSALVFVLFAVTAYGAVGAAYAQVLRNGMRGEEVRALQERLVRLGHDLAVDGIFGRETESVVLQIQELAGISTDGIVGKQTEEVLRILEESVIVYTVQRGDTLSDLAFAYGTTVNQIMRRNGLDNPNQLYAGQRLLIPNISQVAFSGARRTRVSPSSGPSRGGSVLALGGVITRSPRCGTSTLVSILLLPTVPQLEPLQRGGWSVPGGWVPMALRV